jgi:hypothetical protein
LRAYAGQRGHRWSPRALSAGGEGKRKVAPMSVVAGSIATTHAWIMPLVRQPRR